MEEEDNMKNKLINHMAEMGIDYNPNKFRVRAKHKQSTGHAAHDQGCGSHDSRPKRQRTRQSQKAKILKDWQD